MTVKEIAEAVGKDPSTVSRWIEKVSCKMQEVSRKVQQAKATSRPANYTQQETIAIIREGMGDVPAGVYQSAADTQRPNKATKITAYDLQQLRLSVRDGLLSIAEARRLMGMAPVAETEGLPESIAKQVYAVASKAYERRRMQLEDKRNNPELFDL